MCKHGSMRKHIVLTTLLLVAGIIAVTPAQTWTIEQITDNTEQDQYPFVTPGANGFTIVYAHNDGDFEAFIAEKNSGSWTTSRITDNSYIDLGLDIASIPGQDLYHISLWWFDTPDQEISYCTGNTTAGWDIERVTDDGDDDLWPSIEVDANGSAHIVYVKDTGGDKEIFYANNVSGSWISEQVTDNGVEDHYPWLALDSEGNPNIVYIAPTGFFYTKKTAGIWTTPEFIVGGVGTNSLPYLVLDDDDAAHISYAKNDGVDVEIYYANNITGSWQESKVTSNDYNDLYPTLLIDPDGKVHIAYLAVEAADQEIFYADNTAGVWDINRVTDNSVNDFVVLGRFFLYDGQGYGYIYFWSLLDGDFEIYQARSDSPIMSGVEEEVSASEPISISVDQMIFAKTTTVNYSIPQAGNVSLKVYDASGSLVRTLVNGSRPEGDHSVTWNGVTWDGATAVPGVYFLHLMTAGQEGSAKLILK